VCRIATIKELYKELQLKEAFDLYEEESYTSIQTLISSCQVFFFFLATLEPGRRRRPGMS